MHLIPDADHMLITNEHQHTPFSNYFLLVFSPSILILKTELPSVGDKLYSYLG